MSYESVLTLLLNNAFAVPFRLIMSAKNIIWLDCDPGHDDAMAIILAAMHPSSSLLGISTVAGNQSSEKTHLNARAVLATIGCQEIPVLRGQDTALLGPMPYCAEIHGESGLDGLDGKPLFSLPAPAPRDPNWIITWRDIILKEAAAQHQKIHLVCTASLTNVALLLTLCPEIRQHIEISIMGGAMGIGNTGPVAEFNIENDPEAAHIVFESALDITMIPLEVTHTLLADEVIMKQIGRDTPFRNTICELLNFFRDTYKKVFDFDDPPLHDPAAVFYVLHPEAFRTKRMRVDIERGSLLSRGQTVCDVYGRSQKPPNARVALSVDVPLFWKHMVAAVHAVGK